MFITLVVSGILIMSGHTGGSGRAMADVKSSSYTGKVWYDQIMQFSESCWKDVLKEMNELDCADKTKWVFVTNCSCSSLAFNHLLIPFLDAFWCEITHMRKLGEKPTCLQLHSWISRGNQSLHFPKIPP